jgi:hypothetical protein
VPFVPPPPPPEFLEAPKYEQELERMRLRRLERLPDEAPTDYSDPYKPWYENRWSWLAATICLLLALGLAIRFTSNDLAIFKADSESDLKSDNQESTSIRSPDVLALVPGSETPGPMYKSCQAVFAAGAAPLQRSNPGYREILDSDGNGVACDEISANNTIKAIPTTKSKTSSKATTTVGPNRGVNRSPNTTFRNTTQTSRPTGTTTPPIIDVTFHRRR